MEKEPPLKKFEEDADYNRNCNVDLIFKKMLLVANITC